MMHATHAGTRPPREAALQDVARVAALIDPGVTDHMAKPAVVLILSHIARQ